MSSLFKRRARGDEIMDDLDCTGPVVDQTLRELDIINRMLGGNDVTINGLARLLRNSDRSSFTVADLGCGSGDILKHVFNWGQKHKIGFSLTGIDANPGIISFAKKHVSPDLPIRFEVMNVLTDEFTKKKFDIILATLFTHHFSDEQLTTLLSSLKKQASVGIIINDIHRHWLAFYSIRFLTALFSKSSMVKYDAPLSVLRAFRKTELMRIVKAAGIVSYQLRWRWAFRWQLIIPAS